MSNLFIGQRRERVILAGRSVGNVSATFLDHVVDVVDECSEEQMIRTDTRWIVAPMADNHSVRDRAIVEFPRQAVCSDVTPIARKFDLPIVEVRRRTNGASRPKPTTVSLFDLGPEAFFDTYMGLAHTQLYHIQEAADVPRPYA